MFIYLKFFYIFNLPFAEKKCIPLFGSALFFSNLANYKKSGNIS